MKKALITGVTGQDGSYLADMLIQKGYEVHGLIRRSSSSNLGRIEHLLSVKNPLILHEGDLADYSSLKRIIDRTQPDEIYNLAAMSDVKTSFELPEYSADINGIGVTRLLEIIRSSKRQVKLYQASTSELFGKVQEVPQKESTPFYPRSPYGVAKLYGYWAVVNYREAHQIFACNGILFNHESPRRGEKFVSRKISMQAAKIKMGLADKLILGNLDAKRDWGYAKDFVEGMWLMLQKENPDDYVLATGITSTVRDFVNHAFSFLGIDLDWIGKGTNEKGIERATGKVLVEVSPEFFRPTEVELLIGDPSKAKRELGWQAKTSLHELVELMVQNDLDLLQNGSLCV